MTSPARGAPARATRTTPCGRRPAPVGERAYGRPVPTHPVHPHPGARRHLTRCRRALRRRVLAHRRLLAAALAAVAVLATWRTVAPPTPVTVPLLVAARDLPPGERLDRADLRIVRVPPDRRPARAVGVDDALGRTLAAPLGAGEPVSDLRLVTRDLLATTPGLAAVPVRLPDAGVASVLAVGDVVDVVATAPRGGPATVVAAGATVLALPPTPQGDEGPSGAPPGRLVLLGTAPDVVGALAAAAARDYLTVIWTH